MTGGIVEMHSKPINHHKTSGVIDINLMDLSAIINIPISKSLGVNLSARKSIFDQTKNSVFGEIISANQTEIQDDNILNLKGDKDNLSFKYYDINAKLEWEINTKNKLSLSYYNSDDNYLDNYSKVYNIINNAPKYRKLDFNYNDYSSWQNQGLGLTYLLKWNKNLSTDLAISGMKYSENSGLKIGITSYFNGNTSIKDINNSQKSSISDKVFKIDNKWKISNNKILNFGIDLTNYNVVSDIKINDESIYSKKLSASFFNFYSSYKYNWKKWVLKLSIKSSYYTGTSENYFDPSFSLKYYINDKWSLYTTLNRQHQYLREFEYETPQSKNISIWALADNTDPILSANNYSLGCTYKNHNSYFIFELYQKNREGLSILLLPRVGNETQTSYSDYKIIFGNGYVKGLDLMWVQKIKNYKSQISYTYSINKRQFSQSFQNQYYPSPDDSRHQLKWAQNYSLKKWEFGLNLIYSSGTPYFDLSDINKDENRKLLDFNNYIKNLPDYFRADISTGYNFNLLNQKAKIELSVFNLTNRTNISNKQVIYSNNELNTNKSKFVNSQNDLLSRTVNIGFKIKI